MANTASANIIISVSDKASAALDKIRERLRQLGEAKSAFQSINSAADKTFSLMIKGTAATIAAIGGLSYGFVKLSQAAGNIQATERMFQGFVATARATVQEFDQTADQLLDSLRKMTFGTMSEIEMMKSANMAFMLVGEQVANRLPEIFKVARVAALATGKDMTDMVDAISRGIGRLEARWLWHAGIVLDSKKVYEETAASLGKTTGQLTALEKRMAFTNAVIAEGERIALAMGDAQTYLTIRTQSVTAQLKNLRDAALQELVPALSVLMDIVGNVVDRAIPRIEEFGSAFASVFYQVDAEIVSAAGKMGQRAGEWASAAIQWGANVGASFAAGILEGFSKAIVFVMNSIAAILSAFLAPGSPPKVAPDLVKWGMDAIAEWYKGMNEYTPEFKGVLESLSDTLNEMPKRRLLEWGIDAIAEWAKGLSIFDLELLEEQVKQELDTAKKALDEMSKLLDKQETQLFEMQVLGKDPSAIRQQMAEVKATRATVKQREDEVKELERKRDEIREQLNLFRKLDRIIRQLEETMSGATGGRGGGGRGGGGMFDDILGGAEQAFGGISGATTNLQEKMDGFRNWLGEAFNEPLETLATAWEDAVARISESWGGLRPLLEEAGILGFIDDNSEAVAKWAGKVLGVWLAFVLLRAILKPVFSVLWPLGKFIVTKLIPAFGSFAGALGTTGVLGLLVVIALTALGIIAKKLADKRVPELAEKMGYLAAISWILGEALKSLRTLVAIAAILFVDFAASVAEGIVSILEALSEVPFIENVFGGLGSSFSESAASIRKDAQEARKDIRETMGEWIGDVQNAERNIPKSIDNIFDVSPAERFGSAVKKEFDFGEAENAISNLGGSLDEMQTKLGTELPTTLSSDFSGALSDALGSITDFSSEGFGEFDSFASDTEGILSTLAGNADSIFGDMESSIAGSIIPDMTGSISGDFEGLSSDSSGTWDKMYNNLKTTSQREGGAIESTTSSWTSGVAGSFDQVISKTDSWLGSLKTLKHWIDNNPMHVRITVDDIPPQIQSHSPPPLAQGLRAIGDEIRRLDKMTVGIRPAIANASLQPATVNNFNEPLVGSVVIPNQQVGRQFIRDLSEMLGGEVNTRRKPG